MFAGSCIGVICLVLSLEFLRRVAREYDVERYFREARLTRLVPITQELVLNYLGENVLGLPRSY